jgi:hypothetical protein
MNNKEVFLGFLDSPKKKISLFKGEENGFYIQIATDNGAVVSKEPLKIIGKDRGFRVLVLSDKEGHIYMSQKNSEGEWHLDEEKGRMEGKGFTYVYGSFIPVILSTEGVECVHFIMDYAAKHNLSARSAYFGSKGNLFLFDSETNKMVRLGSFEKKDSNVLKKVAMDVAVPVSTPFIAAKKICNALDFQDIASMAPSMVSVLLKAQRLGEEYGFMKYEPYFSVEDDLVIEKMTDRLPNILREQ